jgi:hypothetical protein
MIKNILEILPFVEGGTENIQIAKGKYKYPESFSETFKLIRKELWHKN